MLLSLVNLALNIMFEFLAPVRVDARVSNAAYNCSSSTSYVRSTCFKSMGYSQGAAVISVDMSSGPFTCSVDLLYHPGWANPNLDIVLGRDWFNYCTMAIQDAQLSLTDGRWLVFDASPFHAVFAESDLIGECTCLFIFYL